MYIDIKNVRNANYAIPSIVAGIDSTRKNVNILKWRFPESCMKARDVQRRLEDLNRRFQAIENDINEIYNAVNHSVNAYESAERSSKKAASEFI